MNALTRIDDNRPALAIGAPCDLPGGSRGYIVAIEKAAGNTYTLFGGPEPMARDRFSVIVATESHASEMSENIVRPMLDRARHAAPIDETEAAALWERAKAAQAATRAANIAEMERTEAARKEAEKTLEQYRPEWAQAAIVAELVEDDSDIMTDYFNSRTIRTVVIGWSKHKRDLFPEMRKAAATFAETAHLAEAPADAEHREKYSMGAGYYLKQGWRDSDGWKVSKSGLGYLACAGLEFSDAAKGEAPAAPIGEKAGTAPIEAIGGLSISHHVHTKKGFDMWICSLADRVDRGTYDHLLSEAKARRGWYSRAWNGTPAGFAFKCEDKAKEFAAVVADFAGEC